MQKKGGYHNFPLNFLSQSAQDFCGGTLHCFRKIWVSKQFMHKRARVVSRFSAEKFYVRVRKHLVEDPSVFQNVSNIEKKLKIKKKGGYHDFSSKHFCLTDKKLLKNSFTISLISAIERFYAWEGKKVLQFSIEKSFVSHYRNVS